MQIIKMEREEIIKKIKDILSKYDDFVKEAYLFGSYGKDQYNKYSDIDIAVSCEDCSKFFDICDEINSIETIRRFDIHNIFYEDLRFDMEEIKSGIKL